MFLTIEQKINLLALEILESYGNYKPTQNQIDLVERFITRTENSDRALRLVSRIV